MVQELIQNEADVNYAGQNGTYPLHDCVLGGVLEIAHLLFYHGAYINVVENVYGQSPLMWACQQH
jgi:ankyrin repeat protein